VETNDTSILEARARVPGHVVYRDFVNETVVFSFMALYLINVIVTAVGVKATQ